MKPTTTRRVALVVMALIASLTFSTISASDSAMAAPTACGPTVSNTGTQWIVAPSGGDDTTAIECALTEAAGAGTDQVVRLTDGVFSIGFVHVDGFDGRLVGGGRARTVLDVQDELDCVERYAATGAVDLITFTNSHVRINNLAIEQLGQACAAPWLTTSPPEAPFDLVNAALESLVAIKPALGRTCEPVPDAASSGVVWGVRMTSTAADISAQPFAPSSTQAGVVFGQAYPFGPPPACPSPPIQGNLLVRSSLFDGIGQAVSTAAVQDGLVRVMNNTTRDVDVIALNSDLMGSTAIIRGNDYTTIDAVPAPILPTFAVIEQNCTVGPIGANGVVRIVDNSVDIPGAGGGMVNVDCNGFGGLPPSLDLAIVGNDLSVGRTTSPGQFGILLAGISGGYVSRNTIAGAGAAAIIVDGGENLVNRNTMFRFDPFEADVLLPPPSAGNRVAVNEGDTVLDLGTDNTVLIGGIVQ